LTNISEWMGNNRRDSHDYLGFVGLALKYS